MMKHLTSDTEDHGSVSHHHPDELLVVDLSVTVDVSLSDHLVDLLVSELLTEGGHDLPQLGGRDELVSISVEDLEGLAELLLGVGVLDLSGHQREELGEIDGTVAVGVDLVDHVLELGLRGVLAEGPHDGAQLLGGDGSVAVLVEEGKRLLELLDLLFSQLLGSHWMLVVERWG